MDDKAHTQRFETILAAETLEYLKLLASKGTHGSSVPALGRTLIEDGIRTAIREGFIEAKDHGD